MVQRRVQKYGPISKLSLFGKPTVFIYGQAENKFVFTSDSITLAKAKHKLWRGFWGINVSQNSVDKITSVSGMLLYHFWSPNHWNVMWGKWMRKSGCIWRRVGKENKSRFVDEIYHEWIALCLWKMTRTSSLCSLIGPALNQEPKIQHHLLSSFRIERGGSRRDKLVNLSQYMIEGVWSVAINLFFTRYNCSLQASAKVWNMLKDLIAGKKVELQSGALILTLKN
jgi:cytochrome P450 family 26 subfamily A